MSRGSTNMEASTEVTTNGTILSIQSHVVHGHVGNTAATFPLQLLGYEVDVLNSVQFSNHTGYSKCEGMALEADQLKTLISGLRSNNLLTYSHLLTGYVGTESFLNHIHELLCELKQVNPDIMFVCDPVMGDCGDLYVPESLLPIYRDKLVPEAHVITPNQFEAELLSGIKITSEEDAYKAIDILLSRGTKNVIITSVELELSATTLVLYAGSYKGERIAIEFPKLDNQFTGNGDLFTALLLAWLNKEGLQVACTNVLHTMQAVLKRTLDHALRLSGGARPSAAQTELQLIQSKKDIETPPTSNGILKITTK